jgi:glycosyltransferase involved in cell wall biosynthesis
VSAEARPGADGTLSVLHVTQPFDGGVAHCVLRMAADQVGRGWRVSVAAPDDERFRSNVQQAGAVHLQWPASREPGPALLSETRRLGEHVRASRPDVVHLHSSKAGLAGRLAVRGRLATVFQPHAWSFHAVEGAVRAVAVRWERFAARWADAIICVSEAERLEGEAERIRAAWSVAPNGVDLATYQLASDDDRSAARARLGLGKGPLVVSIGRVARQKGHDVLLTAWGAVREQVPTASLVVVGDGPELERLRSRADASVRFVGARDDVAAWLAASDVVALPSRWEGGASLATLEAMATGRSVVTTDVAGAHAVAGAGAVVPVDDADSLARAIAGRLLDPELARREGLAGRAIVERDFDERRTQPAITEVYREVLARRRASGRGSA